jgi:tetratricopeptide (TPR) repeat protein
LGGEGFGAKLRRVANDLHAWALHLDLVRARSLNDQVAMVDDLLEIGRLRGENQRWDYAEAKLMEARSRAHETGYQYGEAHANVQLGAVHLGKGQLDLARQAFELALPVLRESNDRLILVDALLKVGVAYNKLGKTNEAAAAWKEVLSLSLKTGDRRRRSLALMNLGGVAYDQRKYSEADQYWREAHDLFKQLRDWPHLAYVCFFMGVVSRHFGRLNEAIAFMIEGRDLYKRLNDHQHFAQAEEYLAHLEEESEPSSRSTFKNVGSRKPRFPR